VGIAPVDSLERIDAERKGALMAHSTMHFAIGLVSGTAILLPSVLRGMTTGKKTSKDTGRMLAVSYALAFVAIIPNLLRHAGIPDSFCSGWWMNLFLFNPMLDKLKPGGLLIGELMILVLFVTHYSIIITGIIKVSRLKHNQPISELFSKN